MEALQGIGVILETTAAGTLLDVSLEALAAARALAANPHGPVTAFLPAGVTTPTAEAETMATQAGADRIRVIRHDRLQTYDAMAYTQALALALSEPPRVLLAGTSSQTRDFLPRLAARLQAPLMTEATQLAWSATGNLVVTRPVMGEQQVCTVTAGSTPTPQLVALRPKAFAKPVPDPSRTAVVDPWSPTLPADPPKVRLVEVVQTDTGAKKLEDARIVVSGGRGLKAPENFQMLEALARVLGGSVGATRAVTDAGWRPHAEQIGQTGKTVSPQLYLALGISGQIQHVVGMDSSRIIVAVNKDPDAPIFEIADFGIVGDALQLVPLLTKTLQERHLVPVA